MNRAEWRQLAEDRILDAQHLLAVGRWSGAYYLAGYAVEGGLKACIMAHVENTGAIFEDKKYGEKCWTHDLEDLLVLASLESALGLAIAASTPMKNNWRIVIEWEETTRYQQKTQAEAQSLYDAITNNPDGILPWIRIRW